METPEKQVTLGRALLVTNVCLPLAAAYLYFLKKMPLHIVIESTSITFVVLNVYYLIAFRIWGSKSK